MAETCRKVQESSASECGDDIAIHSCCGGYREHRYRCAARVWPSTATPEIRRTAVRGDCIGPAHAQIEDLAHGLDYQQRKQLTEILALVWDDGFEYGQQVHADKEVTDQAATDPPCAGKAYEHHERTEILGEFAYRWRCPDCGDTGTLEETLAKLYAMRPELYHLQEQLLGQDAVFVLPSDATPGLLGQCFGRDVYRMGGIREPMIALPASQLSRLTMPRITLGAAQ